MLQIFALVLVLIATCSICIEMKYSSHIPDENIQFTSTIVGNEYVVTFRGYYEKATRARFIAAAMKNYNVEKWEIIQRNNVATFYPSDFDILLLNSKTAEEAISALVNHPAIKKITPHRTIQRFIHQSYNNTQERNIKKNQSKLKETFWNSIQRFVGRKLLRAQQIQITDVLQADFLWSKGIKGSGVKVAIFDTGLGKDSTYFRNIKERTDWTDEHVLDDNVGHGTFIAGLIGSTNSKCLGFAPDVSLYIFKVFTHSQTSYTSWFLDAFNYAILKKMNVLNLSIGGPDFKDGPFVDKVWELTANGVIMISAIGNDGPLYGTLNNPADQMDVIGVGGIDYDNHIAKFSSRGMTTWELPFGYGRVKPDIVTYGSSVISTSITGGCRKLSGTSVSSPVVTGAVALILSGVMDRGDIINPGSVKQVLMASAERLPGANMFEQGHGSIDLIKAYNVLKTYRPQATFSPSYIDLTECQYMWPYCTQPIYYGGMPVVVNVTIINGMSLTGYIVEKPKWHPYLSENGNYLKVSLSYSNVIWPWSGWMAVSIIVSKEAASYSGTVQGYIEMTVYSSVMNNQTSPMKSVVTLVVKALIIPTPPKQKRLLWDQFHNLRYPQGYFPRDNLRIRNEPLDWNADHIHTNFKDMYQHLRNAGYYIEVLGYPFTCFNASDYGALLLVDSEDEFFPEEITKLKNDIENNGLSLIVFADWYNVTLMKKLKFFDKNSRQWWLPETGGANIPALNDLLSPWGIALGDRVFDGEFNLQERSVYYACGTSIIKFPQNATLVGKNLKDYAMEMIDGQVQKEAETAGILGFLQPNSIGNVTPGRIMIYGDSNCLDSNNNNKYCFWMLDAMLQYASTGNLPSIFKQDLMKLKPSDHIILPSRMLDNNLHRYSNVLDNQAEKPKVKGTPKCPVLKWSKAQLVNKSPPMSLYSSEKLLSIAVKLPDVEKPHWISKARHFSFSLYVVILFACLIVFVIYKYVRRRCFFLRKIRLRRIFQRRREDGISTI